MVISSISFSDIVEQSPSIIIITNKKGDIQYVNKKFTEISGYLFEEVKDKNPRILKSGYKTDEEYKELWEKITNGEEWEGRLENLTKDGEIFYVSSRISALKDEKGDITGYIAIQEDITNQIYAEMALQQSEKKFRSIFRDSPIGIVISDTQGVFIESNNKFCEIFGYKKDEIRGMSMRDLTHEKDIQNSEIALADLNEGKIDKILLDKRYYKKNGEMIWAKTVVSSIKDDNGDQLFDVALVNDISETKKIEHNLKKSKESYQRLLDSSPIAIVVVRDGIIRYVNHKFNKLFAYSKKDNLIGQRIEIIQPESLQKKFTKKGRKRESGNLGSEQYETTLIKSNGEQFPVSIFVTPVNLPEGRSVLAYIRDLTEIKETEKSLRESEEQLRKSQKMEAIGRLAGGIAHDFNNILTAILGNIEFLKIKIDNQNFDGLLTEIEDIENNTDRATKLIRQLLTFSNQQVTDKKIINLHDIIIEMKQMFGRLIGEDINLISNLHAENPNFVIDRTQLEQLLMNLTINARDAMKNGGNLYFQTQNIEVPKDQFSDLPEGQYVKLVVKDTGTGISNENIDKIFDPFFTTKDYGTGLGLSTVYGIVNQNEGFLEVESGEKGTMFIIYFPSTVKTNDDKQDTQKENNHSDINLSPLNILLVEDDTQVRKLVIKTLTSNNHDVTFTIDGNRAIEVFEEEETNYDMVITDVIMPNLNGFEFAEKIKEKGYNKPILYISGYARNLIQEKGFDLSKENFLQKPFKPIELLEKIDMIFKNS